MNRRALAELRKHKASMTTLLRRRRNACATREFGLALEWRLKLPHWQAYLQGRRTAWAMMSSHQHEAESAVIEQFVLKLHLTAGHWLVRMIDMPAACQEVAKVSA